MWHSPQENPKPKMKKIFSTRNWKTCWIRRWFEKLSSSIGWRVTALQTLRQNFGDRGTKRVLILAMTVFLLVWNPPCTRVRFTVVVSCSDELAVHHVPSIACRSGLRKSRADCSTVGLYCVTITWQQICKGSFCITVAGVCCMRLLNADILTSNVARQWHADSPVTSLGYQGGRKVFWEGPKFFALCPIDLNYVQNIFLGWGEKFYREGFAPPCAPPGYGSACW